MKDKMKDQASMRIATLQLLLKVGSLWLESASFDEEGNAQLLNY